MAAAAAAAAAASPSRSALLLHRLTASGPSLPMRAAVVCGRHAAAADRCLQCSCLAVAAGGALSRSSRCQPAAPQLRQRHTASSGGGGVVSSTAAATQRQQPGWGSTTAAAATASHASGHQQQQQQQHVGAADDPLPTAAYGQVISAEANFVRVNVSRLEQPQQPGSSSSASASIQQQPPPKQQLLCTVRALLKKMGQRVLVGDAVRLHPIDWVAGRGVVDAVQPRTSELADPAVANVDHVLLLFGLTQPPFEPMQVSRFLVSVGASGLPVTLALNKADLLPAAEVDARLAQVASWGYSAVAVSCQSGLGLDSLAARLAGKVSVVAGPSGAGKSSLINALRLGRHKPDAAAMGGAGEAAGVQWQYDAAATTSSSLGSVQQQEEGAEQQQQLAASSLGAAGSSSSSSSGCSERSCDENGGGTSSSSSSSSFLAVGDVSRMGRGRHTTRTVTLIPLPFGGLMADTPGFNQPTLDRVDSSELGGLFPEFGDVQQQDGGCRFADCMHLAEPGCAVTAADLERHEHYVKFLAEIKAREDYDVRVMQLAKARREGATKAKSGRGGATRLEARLNTKKHRATSRRRAKQDAGALWEDEGEAEEGGGPSGQA